MKTITAAVASDQDHLANRIAGVIRGRILYGDYDAGQRISERAITEEFGVSRVPAREALRILQMEGVLEVLPNRGARVPQYDRHLIEQTIEVVEYLEAAAGALACRRINEEQVERIARMTLQMQEALKRKDQLRYYQYNRQIHEAIVASSNNSVLISDYIKYNSRLYRTRFLPGTAARNIKSAMKEHLQIVKLLRQRDGARLSVLLANHLSHAWRRAGVNPAGGQENAIKEKKA